MPTLRSRSVGTSKTSPSPAAAASASPDSLKNKSKRTPPDIATHCTHTAVTTFSLDPVTPAGDREHALSSASLRPQTRGVVRTRQSMGKKKLLFVEQQQQQHAEGTEELVGRRSRKRVRRGGGGGRGREAVVNVVAMEAEAVVTASEASADETETAEKGKRKFVEVSSDSDEEGNLSRSDIDSSDAEEEGMGRNGSSLLDVGGATPSYVTRGSRPSRRANRRESIEPNRTESIEPNRRAEATKAKFLEIARRRAAHFAHFTGEEDEPVGSSPVNNNADSGRVVDEQKKRAAELLAQVSADAGRPDNGDGENQWPGPFVIARQLVEGREAAAVARHKSSRDAEAQTKCSVEWGPSRQPGFRKKRVATSLHNMCVEVLCANIEHVQSLVGVPDAVKKLISARLCAQRTMTTNALRLYFSSEPAEIIIPDCTFVTEETLTEALAKCSTQRLEVLELDLCGRAMSDQICTSALAGFACSLPLLHTLVLNGAYRLTDNGLKALVKATPNLITLNLKQCNMISAAGLEAVANSIGGTLKTLSLDTCAQLDALRVLPPLLKMSSLEGLCLSGLGGMSDGIISELAVILGSRLRELSIADCRALTDAAIRAISLCCTGLKLFDMGHLPSLTDAAIGSLADGCRSLRTLRLDRGKFSDATLAALITASGNCLTELSLNSVRQAGDLTVGALAKHSQGTLEQLDLSFCRGVSDQALGLLADTCSGLHEIRLFGCTQVTSLFVEGHSNPVLNVVGLSNCVLDVSCSTLLSSSKVVKS